MIQASWKNTSARTDRSYASYSSLHLLNKKGYLHYKLFRYGTHTCTIFPHYVCSHNFILMPIVLCSNSYLCTFKIMGFYYEWPLDCNEILILRACNFWARTYSHEILWKVPQHYMLHKQNTLVLPSGDTTYHILMLYALNLVLTRAVQHCHLLSFHESAEGTDTMALYAAISTWF
jgi:hypothetical protein